MSLLKLLQNDSLSRLRLVVVLLIAMVLAPALFRIWCVKGLIRTIRIDGPSMAETLCGNHFRVTCGDCGIIFRCDADHCPGDRLAVCPNCGYRENELQDEDLHRGETVLVDTWSYFWSAPRRGDLVMLVDPLPPKAGETSYAVKRVAALPGERLGIRGGDLLVNQQVVRKSLGEMRHVAALVHDNDFLPRSLPGKPRWVSAGKSDWEPISDGFRFLSTADEEEARWLTYEHWHGTANSSPRTEPAAILDNDSYNQADVRGTELNPARDLLVRCRVRGDTGDVVLAMHNRAHRWMAHYELDSRRFLIRKNGATVFSGHVPERSREFVLEAAICDGVFFFVHNQHVLAAMSIEESPAASGGKQERTMLQIGGYGGPIEVTHIQVWRDIFDLPPSKLPKDWQAERPLPASHYFLLGDNPPVSVDSRQWPEGGVARDAIRGRVIPIDR